MLPPLPCPTSRISAEECGQVNDLYRMTCLTPYWSRLDNSVRRQDQEKPFIQGYVADKKQEKLIKQLDHAAEEAREVGRQAGEGDGWGV